MRDRIQEELEAKMTFVLRNKDELMHRIEALERDSDSRNSEITIKMENHSKRLMTELDSANEKTDRLISVIARLEEDVRVQVDRSIRDLEATDLRQQKEINDLNDQYKELMKNYETFRELITKELREEFLKINENFEQQSKVIAQKEAKLRADMEKFLADNARMANLADDLKQFTIKIENIERIIQQLQTQPKGGASSEETKALAAQI